MATPCKDGTVDVNYATGLAASCAVLIAAGIKYQTAHVCTSSIDNARNVLATLFMKSTCTHLLFIDDDMAWASDLPLRLLNENVDIVGVPYRKKKTMPEYTVKHDEKVASIEGRPWMMKVDLLGMGMTLIRRNVLEVLSESVPQYHVYGDDVDLPQWLFFRHELVTDQKNGRLKYESEDFHFCRLVGEKGFEIWGYVDENMGHIGRRVFSGPYSDHIGKGIEHGFTAKRERNGVNLIGVEQ